MTTICVIRDHVTIKEISASGHSFFDESGKDIVCASISILFYTIANQLLEINEEDVIVNISETNTVFFTIKVKNANEKNQLLLQTLFNGLKMIEEQYFNNIQIKEV